MAAKDVKAFFAKVAEDKALQAKLKALGKKGSRAAEDSAAAIAKIAAAAGFEFSPKDLAQARKERGRKLSKADLQAVAGGAGSCEGVPNYDCWGPYWCVSGTYHKIGW